MEGFKEAIAIIGYVIEVVGVLVIVAGALLATIRSFVFWQREENEARYRNFRTTLGRSIILGLEFLIAGDIIQTVIVSDTLKSIAMLMLIIIIRALLSLTLFLEIEERWPWQNYSEGDRNEKSNQNE